MIRIGSVSAFITRGFTADVGEDAVGVVAGVKLITLTVLFLQPRQYEVCLYWQQREQYHIPLG
jgi:hypothetical protein